MARKDWRSMQRRLNMRRSEALALQSIMSGSFTKHLLKGEAKANSQRLIAEHQLRSYQTSRQPVRWMPWRDYFRIVCS